MRNKGLLAKWEESVLLFCQKLGSHPVSNSIQSSTGEMAHWLLLLSSGYWLVSLLGKALNFLLGMFPPMTGLTPHIVRGEQVVTTMTLFLLQGVTIGVTAFVVKIYGKKRGNYSHFLIIQALLFLVVSSQGQLSRVFGPEGFYYGVFSGIVSVELNGITRKLKSQNRLWGNVPPMVFDYLNRLKQPIFSVMISLISLAILVLLKVDLFTCFVKFIQGLLLVIFNSLVGYLIIYSLGNLLFFLGIHQSVISGLFLEVFLLGGALLNFQAYLLENSTPKVLTTAFQIVYPQMGGTGATLSLIIALSVLKLTPEQRALRKISWQAGIFEINEPLQFAIPIVKNKQMLLPFLLVPIVNTVVGYYFTVHELVSPTVLAIPWITPPLISGFLATAGDWRTVWLQGGLLLGGAMFYYPFLRFSFAKNN